MNNSIKKYFSCISIFLFLMIFVSNPAFSQNNEIKGVTKHKTTVYFGPGTRTTEKLDKGIGVSIIDADVFYLTIKYKDGKAIVLRGDIDYNKAEINKIIELKEKSSISPEQEIYGVTIDKTPVFRGSSEKKVDDISKGQKVLITEQSGNYFYIKHNGVSSRILKSSIIDAGKLESRVPFKSKVINSNINGEINPDEIISDPLTSAGELLIQSSNCRIAGMALSVVGSIGVAAIKDNETKTIIGIAGGFAGLGLVIASEVLQIKAGKMLKKKGISFSTTNNGIGMVYKF